MEGAIARHNGSTVSLLKFTISRKERWSLLWHLVLKCQFRLMEDNKGRTGAALSIRGNMPLKAASETPDSMAYFPLTFVEVYRNLAVCSI